MQLEGTPGHRLVVCYADTESPDHRAMLLLDMLGTPTHPTPLTRPTHQLMTRT